MATLQALGAMPAAFWVGMGGTSITAFDSVYAVVFWLACIASMAAQNAAGMATVHATEKQDAAPVRSND